MGASKLTLSADKEVIRLAKKIAKSEGTSVSALFSGYIRARARRVEVTNKPGPLVRKLTGIMSASADLDERKVVDEALAEKYGLKK